MSRSSQAAFPSQGHHGFNGGLTKIEYFSAMVLQGMVSHPALMRNIAEAANGNTGEGMRLVAEGAVLHAEALIAALDKKAMSAQRDGNEKNK